MLTPQLSSERRPRTVSALSPLFRALLALLVSLAAAHALPGPASGSLLLRGPEPGAAPVEAPRLKTDVTIAVSHVLVRIEPCPDDHRFLLIRVTDTGIGIPQDKLASIFSAFSQADQSSTRRFGGTGLGLSIARRLIEAMGGTVGVESRTGIGSTFRARIPVEAEAAAQPVRRADAVAPGVVLGDLGGATREALAASLIAAGFVAAHVLGEGATAWQSAGMDGVLAKPFTLLQLGQVLAAFLTRSAEAEPVADAQAPRQAEAVPAEAADETVPDGLLDLQTLGSLSEMGDAAFFTRVVQLYTQQAPSTCSRPRPPSPPWTGPQRKPIRRRSPAPPTASSP